MEANIQAWLRAALQRAQADRRLVVAVGVVVLLGTLAFASMAAGSANTPTAASTLPPAAVATSTPVPVTHKTTKASTSPTVVPTANPDDAEAHTPLTLSDPSTVISMPASQPLWQTLLDVTWKLALVLALIYLAMRALAVLKRSGFTMPKVGPSNQKPRFFEQIEEIRLSPQHTLQAVRAGNKVLLLARTGNTLRHLGELDPEGDADAMLSLPPEGFTRQMMRAWTGIMPPSPTAKEGAETEASADPEDPDTLSASDEDVIDAKWVTVEPDAAPPVSDAASALPTKRGTARSPEKPEPLDEATERDILWFAEEHGASAAAERFGLTRQRVTAMRVRYERDRNARELDRHRKELAVHRDESRRVMSKRPVSRPELPDHPRPEDAHTFMPLATTARTNQANAAYARTAAQRGVKPDAMRAPESSDDGSDQAAFIAQTLAARFGIRVQPPTK